MPEVARNTIGVGGVLNLPEGYSIQATADYSETVGAELPDPSIARSGLGLGAFALKPVKPPRACASGRST